MQKRETKYNQGIYRPMHPEKYVGNPNNIIFRSEWERRFLKWCDSDPSILKYASEELAIPYFDASTGKKRRYYPDFIIEVIDKNGIIKKYMVEIKPKRQTMMPNQTPKKKTKTWLTEMATYQKNQCKWEAARQFCEGKGIEFMIVTEDHLGIK